MTKAEGISYYELREQPETLAVADPLIAASYPQPCEKPLDAAEMEARATAASHLLKALSHEGRLMILCHLASGEKSVSELERLLDQRQAAVSQQLARLRSEGIVTSRREGKTIYYSLGDPRAMRVVSLMYAMFCGAPHP